MNNINPRKDESLIKKGDWVIRNGIKCRVYHTYILWGIGKPVHMAVIQLSKEWTSKVPTDLLIKIDPPVRIHDWVIIKGTGGAVVHIGDNDRVIIKLNIVGLKEYDLFEILESQRVDRL